MGHKVVWSPEALDDVDAIAGYIARDSAFYATTVVNRILETSRSLNQFPYLGRAVPELGQDDIRERFVYSYRLVYRVAQDTITVVAVIHGKRQFDAVADRMETEK
jgi:addiction module RelE/StbE family toxin